MLSQLKFTFLETLQISALIPCIFITCYILGFAANKKFSIIPAMYFISLAAGLVYRIIPIAWFAIDPHSHLAFALIFLDSMMPAISFLLILQMAFNIVPPAIFWVILLVPAVATTPFIYAFVSNNVVCTADIDVCFSSESAFHLNRAVVASFIFMLLTVVFARRAGEMEGDVLIRKHKYWLIMCLIIYSILLIVIDLGFATELMNVDRYAFAKVMIKIAFIYMVMTSIFRVFNDHFELKPVNLTVGRAPLTEYEISVGARAEKILGDEKIYREPGFNRANFAKRLAVREHVLSRIINLYFNQSFSELANQYRIREAKELLALKDLSVTAIAYDVGFSSITSFNRVFKEVIGSSPSEFREKSLRKVSGE